MKTDPVKPEPALRPVVNVSIRSDLRDQIRERISTLTIAPSQPIREAELAKQAGVSRTPIRESLLMLEAEGFVDSRRSRGFVAKQLSAIEIFEIQPILASLECLALEQSLPINTAKLAQLTKLNKSMKATKDPRERLRLDECWHTVLVEGCGNSTLLREIARMKALVRRYAIAFLDEEQQNDKSVEQHSDIISRLRAGKIADAKRILKKNWFTSYDEIANLLDSKKST